MSGTVTATLLVVTVSLVGGAVFALAWRAVVPALAAVVVALLTAAAGAVAAVALGAGADLVPISVVSVALGLDAALFVVYALIDEHARRLRQGEDVRDWRAVLAAGLARVRVSRLGGSGIAVIAFCGLAWVDPASGWAGPALGVAAAVAGLAAVWVLPLGLRLLHFLQGAEEPLPLPSVGVARVVAARSWLLGGIGLVVIGALTLFGRLGLPVRLFVVALFTGPVVVLLVHSLPFGLLALLPGAVSATGAEGLTSLLRAPQGASLAGALALSFAAGHALHSFRAWRVNVRLFPTATPAPVERTVGEIDHPCLFSALMLLAGALALYLLGQAPAAAVFAAAGVAGPLGDFAIMPSILNVFERLSEAPWTRRSASS